jgi:hemerythrin-like domain-containing protein
MDAAHTLRNEHETIKFALSVLDKVTKKILRNPDPISIDYLGELIEFFQVFTDKCHHGKEEGFLFPALMKKGIQKNDGPIGVLLDEHEKGRRYMQQLKTLIPLLRKADDTAIKQTDVLVMSYISLMGLHIEKEDAVFFPIADKHLSSEEQADLDHEFEKLEMEKIGAGRHEQFHQMLEKIGSRYI